MLKERRNINQKNDLKMKMRKINRLVSRQIIYKFNCFTISYSSIGKPIRKVETDQTKR